MATLLRRIRDRKIGQWTLAYLAAAWVIMQAVDLVGGPFGLGPGFQRGLTVVLGAGFLAVLIVAWYHGQRGTQRVTGVELLMLATLFVIAASVLALMRTRTPAAPSQAMAPVASELGSIAVMPFESFSGDSAGNRLNDAIHDEILTHLAQIPNLNPISRTSVVALRGARLTAPQIADTLGVRYVLEGSVQQSRDRLEVTVQLIEGRTDRHAWSDSRVFEVADVFALREEVAQWVTEKVLAAVPGARRPESHSGATNTEAYEAYLNGRTWANSRKQEDLARAIDALEKAIALDAGFAPAYASLAWTYGLWGQYGYGGPYATYRTYGRALWLAERAIELDSRLADGYASRGYLLSKAFAPADTVEAAFRAALGLAPSSADLRIQFAHFLAREGRYDQALAESEQAIRLDPVSPGRDSGLGYNALAAGKPDIALRAAERAAVLEPELVAPRVIRALALTLLERASGCLDIELGARSAIRAICLHGAGQAEAAASVMDSVRASPVPGLQGHHVASYYAWTGNIGRALDALVSTFAEGPHGLDFRIIASSIFALVREQPAFQRELERLRREVWARVQRARREAA